MLGESLEDCRHVEDYLVSVLASRSSSQKKEKSPRSPLRATTLDSNVKKSGHVEFREPLASFRSVLVMVVVVVVRCLAH